MDWAKDITIDDLPGDMKLVGEICGIDIAVLLLERLGGIYIYISKSGLNEVKNRYIKKHYNGKNAKSLAIKLGVSERYIFQVLRKEKESNSKRLF